MTKMIKRHTKGALRMHWFNAACWFTLVLTGLGLLDNEFLQPVGMWFVNFWRAIGLQGSDLLVIHATTGAIWITVYTLYVFIRFRSEALFFLGQVTRFNPKDDIVWIIRKSLTLVLGPGLMRKLGLDPTLPPQGFYNAGQKMFAVPAVLGSLGLMATGIILLLSRSWTGDIAIVQWAIAIHYLCFMLVILGLPVHIYMATIAPGEGPAFRSMITGSAPEDFVKHHNPLWYEQLQAKEKGAQANAEA